MSAENRIAIGIGILILAFALVGEPYYSMYKAGKKAGEIRIIGKALNEYPVYIDYEQAKNAESIIEKSR